MKYLGYYIVAGLVFWVASVIIRNRIMYLRRGWKIVGMGRDELAYVERDKGRIVFGAELMGSGPVERVISLPASGWDSSVPEWARGRREEIVARIRSVMPEPRYKYIER